MKTVNQPSAWPTRKLTAALVAAAVMEIAGPKIVAFAAMALAPLGLSFGGPASVAILQIGIAAIAGYVTRDRPNV